MNEWSDSEQFQIASEQLKDGNADFFYQELEQNHTGFFFEVVLSYDRGNMVASNLDLSFFPFPTQTSLNDLSEDQRQEAKRLNRQPEKEPPKLASYLSDKLTICDYTENLLWLITFHSAKILEIRTIISFKVSFYLDDVVAVI